MTVSITTAAVDQTGTLLWLRATAAGVYLPQQSISAIDTARRSRSTSRARGPRCFR